MESSENRVYLVLWIGECECLIFGPGTEALSLVLQLIVTSNGCSYLPAHRGIDVEVCFVCAPGVSSPPCPYHSDILSVLAPLKVPEFRSQRRVLQWILCFVCWRFWFHLIMAGSQVHLTRVQ